MKYLLLAIFLITAESHAAFIVNECDKNSDIENFSKLHKIEIQNYDEGNNEAYQEWLIKVPVKYKKYTLNSLFFTFTKDGKILLRTNLDTHIEKSNALSVINMHVDLMKNIKVYAEYNDHPGNIIFDAPVCRFELVKKHNKSAHRDALPLTLFAVLVAHGLKR